MEAVFDKEGNITNLEELTAEEVAAAYSEKNRSIFGRLTEEEAKRKQAEADLAKAKADLESEKNKVNQEPEKLKSVEEKISFLELAEKKRQFGYEHGLSPEETDRVFGVNPNPTKETLDDPFIKGGLDSMRAKKKLESNMPGASTTPSRFAANKKLEEMKPEEKQAEFDKFMAAKGLRK
jgi:hypothetical protein